VNSDAERLLDELPARIGFVGTVDQDGMPRTVPVWYRWDGERIHITTSPATGWASNLARDGRVSFCVAENAAPYRATLIQGRAFLEPEDRAEVQRIFVRYLSPPDADRYYASIKDRQLTMLRLVPERVTFRQN
jgi:PPOX class probable F420-dependent enzyme